MEVSSFAVEKPVIQVFSLLPSSTEIVKLNNNKIGKIIVLFTEPFYIIVAVK